MKYADKRVLIVEDQRPFLMLLKGLLQSMGAKDVVTHTAAEKALTACRKEKFDIVIADLHLGSDQKNGFELVEELRQVRLIKPSAVFILISADSARPVVLGSIERRPDDYIVKPFSQAQLKSRINRAWRKRQALLPVYRAIHDQEIDTAITACREIISLNTSYLHSTELLLTQLYWQKEDFESARQLLTPYENVPSALWIQIALARTYLFCEEPQQALALCEKILKQNRFSAEAYDIIASARQQLAEGDAAIAAITHAVKLSPYSLPRFITACDIARKNNDFVFAHEACAAIWKLTRHTANQHIAHWCTYIRSMLDVAEHTEEKRLKNRYQQEALLHLQRGRHDERISRLDPDFDFDIFEQMVMARMAALDGKFIDAKHALFISQRDIDAKYDSFPVIYAQDSLNVMLELGEFEDAQPIINLLNNTPEDNNAFVPVQQISDASAQRHKAYLQHNREGISLYQQGKFEQAREQFNLAQGFAPLNTGVALNLIQCILKLTHGRKTSNDELVSQCRKLNKLLNDIPLKPQHQQKFDGLRQEIDELLGSGN
ncbi:response regulator [Salinimonas chungwhensis]|uniref:response regulator n=1 Tax=Salinimonas chungwhensis TaxID=265425 RepID=UPI0003618807|nr:response regulator [Salinimonas chungwhensis]